MALLNEIQDGRLNSVLHKLLDMKEGAPSPQLAGDVQPTLVLESDRPEWKFLAGETLAIGGSAQIATAAALSHIQIINRNPSLLVTVEEIVVQTPSGSQFVSLGRTDAIFAGGSVLVSHCYRDARYGATNNQTGAELFRQTNAASLLDFTFLSFYTPANAEPYRIRHSFVLPPNTGLGVQNTTLNDTLAVAFVWRERFLNPSEQR